MQALNETFIKNAGALCSHIRHSARLTQKKFLDELENRTRTKISSSVYSRVENAKGERGKKKRKDIPWEIYGEIKKAFGLDLNTVLSDQKTLRLGIMKDVLPLMAQERLNLLENHRERVTFNDRQLDLIEFLTEHIVPAKEDLEEPRWYQWLRKAKEGLSDLFVARGWGEFSQAESQIHCEVIEDFLVWVGDWQVVQPLLIETLRTLRATMAQSGGLSTGSPVSDDRIAQVARSESGEIARIRPSNEDTRAVSEGALTTAKPAAFLAASELRTLTAHDGPVSALAFDPRFSPQGGHFLSGGNGDNTVCLWDNKAEVLRFDSKVAIRSVAFTPDGRYAALEDGAQRHILDLQRNYINSIPRSRLAPGSAVSCVALSADGRFGLDGCQDGSLWLWDWTTGADRKRLQGHEGVVHAVAFSPDGRFAVSGGLDSTLRFWNLESGDQRLGVPLDAISILALRWHTGGRHILVATEDAYIRGIDFQNARETTRWKVSVTGVTAMALSADTRFALTGSADGTVRLWHLSSENVQ